MKISAFLLIIYFALPRPELLCQTIEIDSLKMRLSSEVDVELQLKTLHSIVLKSTYINLDTASKYVDAMLKLSETSSKNEFKSKSFHAKADIERRRSNYDEALALVIQAESYAVDSAHKVKIYNCYGNIYNNSDKHELAEKYYLMAINLAINEKLFEDVYMNYNNMAILNFRKGMYKEALEYNYKALKIIDSLNLKTRTGSIYGVIGVIHQNMGEFDLAYQNYNKAIEADSLYGDKMGIITWKINWAIALENESKYEDAERLYQATLLDTRNYGYPALTANVLCNIGALYKKQGLNNESISTFMQAYELSKKINAKQLMAFSIQNLGGLVLIEGDLRQARAYLNEGKLLAYELNDIAMIRDFHLYHSNYFRKIGKYDSALFEYEKHILMRDSILGESKIKEIGKLEAQYEFDKEKLIREKEFESNLLIEQEKRKRQLIVLIVMIVASIIISFLLILIYRRLKVTNYQKKIIEQQSEKLKALDIVKTNFFANISHDLRSPLTLLLGSIDQVLSDNQTKLSHKAKELLNTGYRNGKKLLFMADEIRDLTRLQEGKIQLKPRPVRLQGYLSLLVKMFGSAAALKNINMHFEASPDTDLVANIDPHQFEKVIYNLLSNAVKHTHEGGEIAISLDRVDNNPNKASIQIRDTGVGIPQNHLEHIFDRYYQVPDSIPGETIGLGIGLALCKEIIELHKGEIKVESEESLGTTFIIHIATDPQANISSAIVDEYYDPTYSPLGLEMSGSVEVKTLPNARNVLIVEDHREIRNYLATLLNDEYNIIIANNGEEALEILKNKSVHLILSDLMMPYMDGFELVKQLKEDQVLRQIPVLIVSARTGEEDKLQILSLGADEVLPKPFTNQELKLRVKHLLEKSADNKLLQLYEPNESQSGLEELIRHKIETLIMERIDDPNLSVIDFTEVLAASERKVFRMVKKIFNMTPLDLIKELRWKYLETLLRNNQKLSATEAAKAIGIANVTYFKKQYEEKFGKPYS